MNPQELAQKAYDRHTDLFNEYMLGVHDHCLLSVKECDELLTVINDRLPGPGNRIVHSLRLALCEAIDIIRCEDVLIQIREMKHP